MKNIKCIAFVILCMLFVTCSTEYKSLTVTMPDLSSITDGVYTGEYDLEATPVKVTLEVVVQDLRITKINLLKHVRSPVGKKAEKIIERVIENQSLDVDVISGATASSKAILQAVENALSGK